MPPRAEQSAVMNHRYDSVDVDPEQAPCSIFSNGAETRPMRVWSQAINPIPNKAAQQSDKLRNADDQIGESRALPNVAARFGDQAPIATARFSNRMRNAISLERHEFSGVRISAR